MGTYMTDGTVAPPGGISTVVKNRPGLAKNHASVFITAMRYGNHGWLTGGHADEFFFPIKHNLHRPTSHPGQDHGNIFIAMHIKFITEGSADGGQLYPNIFVFEAHGRHQMMQVIPYQVWYLRRQMNGKIMAAIKIGDNTGGSHAAVVGPAGSVGVFDDVTGFLPEIIKISIFYLSVDRQTVAFDGIALEIMFMNQWCTFSLGLKRIKNSRQRLIFHFNQFTGLGGDFGISSGNRCHFIPKLTYLVAFNRRVVLDKPMRKSPAGLFLAVNTALTPGSRSALLISIFLMIAWA